LRNGKKAEILKGSHLRFQTGINEVIELKEL
jgi:hypothetical protein